MIIISGFDASVVPYGVIRTGSNTNTISVPSLDPANPSKLVQPGDLAVLFDFACQTGGYPTFVVPSGWTHAANIFGGPVAPDVRARAIISYRVLTAGQPGVAVTGMNGNLRDRKIMMTFRMSRPILSVTSLLSDTLGTMQPGTTPSTTIVNAAGNTGNIIVLSFGGAELSISDAAFSVTNRNGSAYNDLGESAAGDGQGDGIGGSVTRGAYNFYLNGTNPVSVTNTVTAVGGDIISTMGAALRLT
jgi:hypothetical protein